MSLRDSDAFVVETTTATESLPDPTTVNGRTHLLVNTGTVTAVWSSVGALPFRENNVAVATISVSRGQSKIVQSDGTQWITSSTIIGVASGPLAESRFSLAGTPRLALPGIDPGDGGAIINTLAANEVRYHPIYVTSTIEIDALVVEVTTGGVGGSLLRLGLYNADINWNPTTLVVDGGSVAADSIGVKTAPASAVLAPGRYMTALNTTSIPAVRGVRGGNRYMGYNPALSGNIYVATALAVQAFGALPATATAITTSANANLPFGNYVFLRILTP